MKNAIILGIDPGSEKSAIVVINTDLTIIWSKEIDNDTMRDVITRTILSKNPGSVTVAIETIQSFGMAVANSVFVTARWAGRFEERAVSVGAHVELIGRRTVKHALLGNVAGGDKGIIEALRREYSKRDLSLEGIASHRWSALAVAVCCAKRMQEEE